ncbi:hypothetical protein ACNKHW_14705 [Shigella flexneri]
MNPPIGGDKEVTVVRTIILIPTGTSISLTSVSLGVIRGSNTKALSELFQTDRSAAPVGMRPIRLTPIVRAHSSPTTAAEPLDMDYVESVLTTNRKDMLMEEIVARPRAPGALKWVWLKVWYRPVIHQFAQSLNYDVAQTLGAEIVFVTARALHAGN